MTYDYIVIGAGSAGATIATRLTEDPNISVLLLEAGDDFPEMENIPEEVKYTSSRKSTWESEHNWKYNGTISSGREIPIPRGKVTGGSSSINATIFLRGSPEDYDNWSKWGNDQWSYQKLLPYFNKLETDTTYQENPGDFHGGSGPILCRRFPKDEWLPGSTAFVQAALDMGFPYCEDANMPGTTGTGPLPLNNPNGIRWSTSIGYLGQSRHRLNLTIRPNVSVKKILIQQRSNIPRAYGVQAVSGQEQFEVHAGEIILSAGAIASPQLLMLSGIGPKAHLEQHGINVIHDSPGVGQNLSDHPLIEVIWATKPGVDIPPSAHSNQTTLRYTADGSMLENDMIVYFRGTSAASTMPGGFRRDPIGIACGLGLNLALSKGEVTLRSSDYRDQPFLSYNLMEHPEDLRRYRDGIRMLVDMENNSHLAEIVSRRLRPLDDELHTDSTLNEWIKLNVGTGHHVSCTAKMGPDSDPMAVVNQFGKTYGIDGLRVADASIMPECVRANINVTVIAIGERIADFILEGK